MGLHIGRMNVYGQSIVGENSSGVYQGTKQAVAVGNPEVFQVYGDLAFAQADAESIRRAGLLIHRLSVATGDRLKAHWQRMREDNVLPKLVHFSSHAGPSGILLQDSLYGLAWWSDLIRAGEIDVLFLASCENVDVADVLLGCAKQIVCTLEPISDEDAAAATYGFWKTMRLGQSVEVAFSEAKRVAPGASSFLYLRG